MLKVIALGNTLRGDDGVGPVVIGMLRDMIGPDTMLLDLGSDAFELLEHLQQPEPILIIDCARMGQKPGGIRRFTVDSEQLGQLDQFISLHGFSFSEIYRLAAKLGSVAPCRCIGIEPGSCTFNTALSLPVKSSIPAVIQMVFEEIQKYEEKNNYY